MAQHENLNVTIDFALIKELLADEKVHLRKREDKKGVHKELTFFVKVRKGDHKYSTHNVTVKEDGTWKDLRNKEGEVIYVGTAKPSKYQPDEDGGSYQDPRQDNSDDDIF